MQTVGGLFLIGFGIVLAGLGLRAGTTDPTLGDGQGPIATVEFVSPPPAISAVVTLPPAASSRDVAAVPQPAADMPSAGPALVRELQRELTRVGCYDGAINGAWTEPSRQALRAFIEHVNAKLPTGHAEFAHLAPGAGPRRTGMRCLPRRRGDDRRGPLHRRPERRTARNRRRGPPHGCAAAPSRCRADPERTAKESHTLGTACAADRGPDEHRGRRPSGRKSPEAATRLAYAPPEVAQPPAKQRRAARQRHRALAHGRPRHLRAMRPARFAFRPFRRSRGGGLFFGLF